MLSAGGTANILQALRLAASARDLVHYETVETVLLPRMMQQYNVRMTQVLHHPHLKIW